MHVRHENSQTLYLLAIPICVLERRFYVWSNAIYTGIITVMGQSGEESERTIGPVATNLRAFRNRTKHESHICNLCMRDSSLNTLSSIPVCFKVEYLNLICILTNSSKYLHGRGQPYGLA